MKETDIEASPKAFIDSHDGFYIKLPAITHIGIPDRLVILPYKCVFFVETKTPENDLTEIQRHVHNRLRKLGFSVFTLESKNLLIGLVKLELSKAREAFKNA